jgi:two-component system, cell cycle sensor histidine kinase and response regulator CckA
MAAAAKHRIIIVEDEGLIAADLESRLKAAGYLVPGTADSAQPALQLIRETSPDLVLMDIRLKGDEDGVQVADLVRQEHDIPVIYLTAYEDRATLERAGRTQAFGYIRKPIASASLKGAIEIGIAKHRYERELREERDWAVASFGSVPCAIVVTDASGRVSYLNSQAEELVGFRAQTALRRPATEILRLCDRDSDKPIHGFLTAAMLHGDTLPLPANSCLHGSAGRTFVIEGHVAPRWRNGRIDGAVITLTDVTLCRFEEQQSRQESKEEALMRMADGIIRHMPQLETLAQESTRMLSALPSDSPLRQSAETIEKAALDAFAVSCHLREFVEPAELDCQALGLNDVLERLAEAWKMIQPHFELRLSADAVQVHADEWQLLRALMNVLLHARTHMQASSSLVVDLSCGEPEQLGQWARIRATYTTRQEDATALEHAFEPSWSGASEDLHITYALVKRMGGMVMARLERGNAVTFEVYLPRVQVLAAAAGLPEPEMPATLLIESNREIRRVIRTHFQQNGHKLLEAGGCEEGLIVAELYKGSIPLVIVNPAAHDPARDGIAEKLNAARPDSQLRILSSYSQPCQAVAGRGLEVATTRHLTKWDLLEWAREASNVPVRD